MSQLAPLQLDSIQIIGIVVVVGPVVVVVGPDVVVVGPVVVVIVDVVIVVVVGADTQLQSAQLNVTEFVHP
jgi:hypothetical protein